jgi:hypothetical protein
MIGVKIHVVSREDRREAGPGGGSSEDQAMSRGIVAAVTLALAGAASLAVAPPAKADGFSLSYSTGHYGPGWDRHHRHYHRPPPRVVYYAPRPVYRPPPRVIYAPAPTVVYADPPPVIYAAPPPVVYAAPPPAVASNALPGGPLQPPAPYCREYQTTTTVGGRTVSSYGTACQQPDGSWRLVE